MDQSAAFDRVLASRDKDAIFRWAMERLIWNPESLEARAMAAFAFLAVSHMYDARAGAKFVLGEDTDQPWAVAALFATYDFEQIESAPYFFEEGEFKLGPEWNTRFKYIGWIKVVNRLMYFQALYGPKANRGQLVENWTVSERPFNAGWDEGAAGDPFCAVNK
jgi:hypothetical protein